jgi:alkylhydroperoxidase/carboxymuconolactone decarboxylase family protein YurZ
MSEHPLKVFETLDPELLKAVQVSEEFTFVDGALPKKFKLLIAMTLDTSLGSAEGVKVLAGRAMQAGATKEEIGEAIRVARLVCGVSTVHVAARGLKEIF